MPRKVPMANTVIKVPLFFKRGSSSHKARKPILIIDHSPDTDESEGTALKERQWLWIINHDFPSHRIKPVNLFISWIIPLIQLYWSGGCLISKVGLWCKHTSEDRTERRVCVAESWTGCLISELNRTPINWSPIIYLTDVSKIIRVGIACRPMH